MVRIGLFGEISNYFSFYFGLVLKWIKPFIDTDSTCHPDNFCHWTVTKLVTFSYN